VSVVWLAGPVGAGKSTLARALRALVNPVTPVALLDEDDLRNAVLQASGGPASGPGSTPPTQLSGVALVLAHQGLVVIVSASGADPAALLWNRSYLPGYREIELRVSTETIEYRAGRRSPAGPARPRSRPALAAATPRPAVPEPHLVIDMDNPEPPELLAFRVAVLIPEFVAAASGAAAMATERFRRGA
jgi:energy-coupling factor transporter ATP-binding protein EcfA2